MRPCHSFLRREDVLWIGHLVVILFRQCNVLTARYLVYVKPWPAAGHLDTSLLKIPTYMEDFQNDPLYLRLQT